MTVTLNLDPEKEARLRRKAEEHGQDLVDYLLFLAGANADLHAAENYPRTPLPQDSPEWEAMLKSMEIKREPGVSLSIEATSRESIYEDD